MKKRERIVDLSPKSSASKKLPKGYIKYKPGMKIKPGDRIIADLGGLELCRGTVYNPDDDLLGKKRVSFWSYSGWKHLEFANKRQIKGIKKK